MPSAGEGGNAPNRTLFPRCGYYDVRLRYTVETRGFSTVHTRPHRGKQLLLRIMASHRSVGFFFKQFHTQPQRVILLENENRTAPHRTAPKDTVGFWECENCTAPFRTIPTKYKPHRTAPYDFENRKSHRGAVLHTAKSLDKFGTHSAACCVTQIKTNR